jgi:aminoglycoside 2'-N-acetyltransferase I
MTTLFTIRVASRVELGTQLSAQVAALCAEAYEEPFEELLAEFTDSVHVLGFVEGALVSHALWVARDLLHQGIRLRTAYVEAVATRPLYRGRGYASAVLRVLASEITDFDLGALSPFDPAYYARLGWESWLGPRLLLTDDGAVPTPDEEVMILRLPGTPALDLHGSLTAFWRPGDIW